MGRHAKSTIYMTTVAVKVVIWNVLSNPGRKINAEFCGVKYERPLLITMLLLWLWKQPLRS